MVTARRRGRFGFENGLHQTDDFRGETDSRVVGFGGPGIMAVVHRIAAGIFPVIVRLHLRRSLRSLFRRGKERFRRKKCRGAAERGKGELFHGHSFRPVLRSDGGFPRGNLPAGSTKVALSIT